MKLVQKIPKTAFKIKEKRAFVLNLIDNLQRDIGCNPDFRKEKFKKNQAKYLDTENIIAALFIHVGCKLFGARYFF
ncbi:hypothetical protein DERP_014373 [Dermatophagoides pteronyssinus]|uniref:Uncharacterized protein n=1 Tax=Dermatophagoides pteronyssinus TaxID=6956 RepID=A0ABQ8IV09_DERPT|nr:hypothetical protein DERP_014373 [Dermatophagoides pteronyssinus]